MKTPLISVILTSYNDEQYLERSLKVLLNQTLKEIEIICVDDASSDKSVEVIKKVAGDDARVKIIAHSENQGVSAARNDGIEAAQAELIMFCDGDDYYEPETCERMYEAVTRDNADLAICEINVIYQANAEMKTSDDNYYTLKYDGLQNITDQLVMVTDLAPTNKIFRRKLMDKYQIRFPVGLRYEDAFFCSAYLMISKKIFFLNERLYNYVRNSDSFMAQTWSGDKKSDPAIDHTKIAIKLFEFLEKHNKSSQYTELYWQLFESFLSFSITNSKTAASRKATRELATSFIAEHKDSFDKASLGLRERIDNLCLAKFQPNLTRVKRTLIKVMPTYHLQVNNIQQLRALRRRCKHVSKIADEHFMSDTRRSDKNE